MNAPADLDPTQIILFLFITSRFDLSYLLQNVLLTLTRVRDIRVLSSQLRARHRRLGLTVRI